jgi:eukaryotic-like serine/threonine-protein kinase
MPLRPGQNIGDYEIITHLGQGGVGEVYKVRHVISQRVEALKLLRSDRNQADLSDRFLREIRLLAGLSHPHIARLNTAFQHDDQIAMVMEFIEGEDLYSKLHSPWPHRAMEGINYVRQVLSALVYAHARGVIHRDIKPSNIMITFENEAKLLDFGMAFQSAEMSHTRPGYVLGSLHYMSPEQVRGERVDARSDLYSTGVTLYEILTGRRPFDGKTEYEVMTGHLREEPKRPADLNPSIPDPVSQTILRSMAKEASQRFQNAIDFLAALEGISFDDAQTLETLAIKVPPPSSGGAQTSSKGSGARPSGGSFEPKILDSVSRELAAFIGPIAKVVVKRAADRCSSMEELYACVAAEIDSERDRSQFLAKKKAQ